jgi:hypothetical protein
MPKAVKERAKHSASLAAQIQNDKNPQVSVSKRAKMKRQAQDEAEAEQSREQVIEGKLGRQILTMAREQMDDEDEDEDDSEQENEMKWREAQVWDLPNGSKANSRNEGMEEDSDEYTDEEEYEEEYDAEDIVVWTPCDND